MPTRHTLSLEHDLFGFPLRNRPDLGKRHRPSSRRVDRATKPRGRCGMTTNSQSRPGSGSWAMDAPLAKRGRRFGDDPAPARGRV